MKPTPDPSSKNLVGTRAGELGDKKTRFVVAEIEFVKVDKKVDKWI
jgi:hypothetical protein